MDAFTTALNASGRADDEYLKLTEQNLRVARRNHNEVAATADLLLRLDSLNATQTIRRELVTSILGWANRAVSDYSLKKYDPEFYTSPGFLEAFGIRDVGFKQVDWTQELLGRGLNYDDGAVEPPLASCRRFRATSFLSAPD